MQSKAHLFPEHLVALAAAHKALSHPARLEILRILAARKECICDDLTAELPLAQSTVSQHLKVLKEAGLIQGQIDGPRVCYCIDPLAVRNAINALVGFLDALHLEAADCC